MAIDTRTDQIREWRSIVTLIAFFLANIVVLFPFHIPIYVPARLWDAVLKVLRKLRVIPREEDTHDDFKEGRFEGISPRRKRFKRFDFPMNSITAPLIADLFLLAILAIGREEVYDGTIGQNGIHPLDIMVFFLTLAYIAISIDASGLIRYLALKVLQWGGKVGYRLFFYLYAFFFCLGTFIGNDPIILSGTAFLAYMTRISNNIKYPRAWIFTQFSIANIASAILVSSNPTNLVLAGAFDIKFVEYTANMVVPVVVTAIVLFPFLLYIIFADKKLIPESIEMFQPPEEAMQSKPVNPNIPNPRGAASNADQAPESSPQAQLLSAIEILNPWLDKGGAAFGAVVMSVTLITVLALNAANVKPKDDQHLQVFWVTLPAAFIMLCWDLAFGWSHRKETRRIAQQGREGQDEELVRAEEGIREKGNAGILGQEDTSLAQETTEVSPMSHATRPEIHIQDTDLLEDKERLGVANEEVSPVSNDSSTNASERNATDAEFMITPAIPASGNSDSVTGNAGPQLISSQSTAVERTEKADISKTPSEGSTESRRRAVPAAASGPGEAQTLPDGVTDIEKGTTGRQSRRSSSFRSKKQPATLVSRFKDGYRWSQETFPTVMAVLSHLPFALVPFAFAMFVLVQALVTKGWVPVFAYGWDHWVEKTGTIGAIGGMGFLSVILCNFAGTNIGTTILLSRVIQAWQQIHRENGVPISERTFWATVYSMALGVNYGAFSTAFSASLAGLLWRDILERKHIFVSRRDFARENIPIIAIAMTVGCTVLVGEIYITRTDDAYPL
ncbi:arsenite efflux transporter [Colletotrichum abscissum]|uniref:Arsenite efflux transporter n=1 Tax=Colletotrichum abscissum TaxID=1671311 RepID=A0A9Q0BA45_9PEZI|nr:arsenite efflux transporter [Colletotrichum abscissum]KAI3558122.1 arsenite efflux transporter [Colletotrichum abscissum]KAK1482946.1 arsenite efflux transporter [Colletotrichum abscissum]